MLPQVKNGLYFKNELIFLKFAAFNAFLDIFSLHSSSFKVLYFLFIKTRLLTKKYFFQLKRFNQFNQFNITKRIKHI